MPPIHLNWSDLEIAFERNSPDQESFLDLDNGDLLAIVEGEPDAASRRAKVAANPERYLRIDPASSREQYRWMERFVSSVTEPALRERLLVSIDGKGAFRRFKDVLLAFPGERERWFAYRSEVLHFHIQTWIDHMKIEVASPPPWGRLLEPLEPIEIPRAVSAAEPPGETLRRQARELLDVITAAELPSAIAFLEFLRDRGTAPILRSVKEALRDEDADPTTPEDVADVPDEKERVAGH
jgi:hypothetical protein